LSIDEKVAFAAIDFLATIKATLRTTDIRCLDRLAVDDRRAWLHIVPEHLSDHLS